MSDAERIELLVRRQAALYREAEAMANSKKNFSGESEFRVRAQTLEIMARRIADGEWGAKE